MSAENVEIVRELMAVRERARESGEPPTRTDLVAPDFEIDMSPTLRDGQVTRVQVGVDPNEALKAVGLEK